MHKVKMSLWIFVALGSFQSLGSFAFQPKPGISPEDIAKLKTASQALMSPDNAHIAVQVSVPRDVGKDSDGPAWSELHILNRQTGKMRPFIGGKQNISNLTWLPDSSGLAFTTKRGDDAHTSLYIIPVDGGEARRVAALDSGISAFSLSPDGLQAAILADDPADKDQEKLEKMGFSQRIQDEDWDFKRLFIVTLSSIEKPRRLELPGSAFQVAWSSKGNRIAVSLAPSSLVDARYTAQKIHIIDATTGEIQQVVNHEGKLGTFTWRPDGEMLAFIGALDKHDPSAGRLWLYNLATSELSDPLNNHEGQIADFAWQSDKHIMFIDETGVWTRLAKVGIDGKGYKELVAPGGDILTAISLSQDGQHAAFIGESSKHPSEVFTMSHGEKGPRRMTHLNSWLEDRSLGNQEVIRFNARDGLALEGVLIYPAARKGDLKVPLVLYVHGGPEAHHHNGWLTSYSSPGQVAAGRGMAVFHTNYRGSTGRGVAFSKLSQGDAAGKEFDDLVDAVDHLIAKGLVDPAKVGITGGSYGGFATAWGATFYSDRFAAGVMFVGISNTISKVGTTDIPEEEFLVHALKRPWDDWRGYLESSPIFHSANHKTPLLILHGTDDPRVNVGQSRELYRHLKIRNQAPVRLVLYPGEGHGNRRAASRYDYHLRAMRWLEHYLLGPGGEPPAYPVDYQLEP